MAAALPSRLRPTAAIAADAVLVGDPGRALLLAQALLVQPKMSNHARGLWGYWGRTPAGAELTIQATGMGAPSAALVLADLAELGVRRVVRVGTCTLAGPESAAAQLLIVEAAIAAGGSATAFGLAPGAAVLPDRALSGSLRSALGASARIATVASLDLSPAREDRWPDAVDAVDLQTAAILARARDLEIAAAAVLIGVDDRHHGAISDQARDEAAKIAGRAAATILSI